MTAMTRVITKTNMMTVVRELEEIRKREMITGEMEGRGEGRERKGKRGGGS